jgi:arylsulfatase A-like enzyme
MKDQITRRDFLKLAGLLPLSVAAPRLANSLPPGGQTGNPQNIIVIVFDAFSAYNMSLHGYQRETTPNLARLAERAVVYHNHYASGNSTMPGTASLLTGAHPWTHRAFGLDKKTVEKSFVSKNIFSAFQNYYRLAYTHNPVADRILTQFSGEMEEHIPLEKLFLVNDGFINALFKNDKDTVSVSWVRAMKRKEEGYAYSLFLSRLIEKQRERIISDLRPQYPGGIPHIGADEYFLLEDAVDWLGDTLDNIPQPFVGYFHFLPPHRPYLTHRDFQNRFAKDGFTPEVKPPDLFTKEKTIEFLLRKRIDYDEFILYLDREFGRFMDKMNELGLLENTWVILTSDHGEMFERGILGHITPVLYQPLVRIPLVIFEPGRKIRTNIYSNTSAVDLLPTLLHVTGQKQASWCEGDVLPPYAPNELNPERNLYVVQARRNDQYKPLTIATIVLVKEQYKLMYFFGYEELGVGKERVELYDIEKDPEELNNLYSSKRDTANEMLHDLKAKLAEVNTPYL